MMQIFINRSLAIRFCLQTRRCFADVPQKSKMDPMVPKLNIPPEYAKLYDIKQEPGFVIVNGRRYPYPYPGIHGEYNYLDMMEKWRAEGKLDRDNRPIFWKMKGMEWLRAKQLWYQRDPTLPVWKLGKRDHYFNICWATLMVISVLTTGWMFYKIVVPKDQDIYDYKNWVRWKKESHH